MNIIIFIFICIGFFVEVAYMTLLERKIMAAIQRRRGPINMVKFFYFSISRWIINCFNFLKQSILSALTLAPETKVISMDFFAAIIITCVVGGATIAIISTFFPDAIPPLPKNFEPEITNSSSSDSSSTDASSSLSENVNVENTNTSIFNIYHKIVENIKNIFVSNVNVENTNTSNDIHSNSDSDSDSDSDTNSDKKGPTNVYEPLREYLKQNPLDQLELDSKNYKGIQSDSDAKGQTLSKHLDNHLQNNELSINERDIVYDFMQIIEDKDEDKSNYVINDEISSSSSSSDKKGKKPVNKSPISDIKPTVKKKNS